MQQLPKCLVMLWLIASEDDGRIPDTKTLAFRLRMSEKQTKEMRFQAVSLAGTR
jgi:hypothetical protein